MLPQSGRKGKLNAKLAHREQGTEEPERTDRCEHTGPCSGFWIKGREAGFPWKVKQQGGLEDCQTPQLMSPPDIRLESFLVNSTVNMEPSDSWLIIAVVLQCVCASNNNLLREREVKGPSAVLSDEEVLSTVLSGEEVGLHASLRALMRLGFTPRSGD